MPGMNKVEVAGRLGRDPEMRYTPNGHAVTDLSVAAERSWQAGGEWKSDTEWTTVTVWGGLAEKAAEILHKGDLVYVFGYLKTESWDKDGVKHYRTKIIAQDLAVPLVQSTTQGAKEATHPEARGHADSTEDIPF